MSTRRRSTRSSITATKINEQYLESFKNIVLYRDNELNILHDLLIKSNKCLYPLIHLYGLSGSGKTYFIRNFLNLFTTKANENSNNSVYYFSIYLNLVELCYQSVQYEILFNEIIIQLCKQLNIEYYDEYLLPNSNDITMFLRNINKILMDYTENIENINIIIVVDHADALKYLNSTNEQNHVFLLLCKLNEYLNEYLNGKNIINLTTCTLFISEIEWHSLISECNLMSQTETTRPIQILFQNYNKDQMFNILTQADETNEDNDSENKLMYIRIILDVFFTICKDLNELNYLIETYYQQLKQATINDNINQYESTANTINLWNKIKPYLKQALTKIYLRESFTIDNSNEADGLSKNLTKEFECLNIDTNKILIRTTVPSAVSNSFLNKTKVTIELPLFVKYILIAAYIATHNSSKYDKKLFDYHSAKTYRKQKYNANTFQKIDETRRVASIKLQQFDLNRLLAIFYTIIMDNTQVNIRKRFEDLNLSIIQCEIETLKNLNYIQQCNGSFSNLDEPKYKCLIDFDTISLIALSVGFNIKQYLAEYFLQ